MVKKINNNNPDSRRTRKIHWNKRSEIRIGFRAESANHFFKQSVAVFGELNISSTTNEPKHIDTKSDERNRNMEASMKIINNDVHFDCSFRTEIALEDILQALRGIDIHVQSGGFVENFCIWIEYSQRHLSFTYESSSVKNQKQRTE